MSEVNSGDAFDDVPQATVDPGRGLSIIWLIPLVAVLIGGWLAYKAISEQGPVVMITFKSAEGLEARNTRIKYKAVEVGEVERIEISDDLSNVVVTASLVKNMASHLNEGTRFWVVRPRLGASGVSGLDTLVSGAYIEIEPGQGEPVLEFKGLETPPVVRSDSPGYEFVLKTEELGSLQPSSPVYFRQLKVGEVLGYEFVPETRQIEIHIFVEQPYHTLVRDNSRFWHASGLEISMDANGVNLKTESIQSILSGGIAFDSPSGESAPGDNGATFALSRSFDEIGQQRFTEKIPYVVYFGSSVRGLTVGSPVEFRGIKVGSVTNVRLEYDSPSMNIQTPVYIELEPQRVSPVRGEPEISAEEVIELLIERGLRAQLQTASLITGQQYIEVELHPGTPRRLSGLESAVPELPTIPSTIDAFTGSATQLLAQVRDLPLDVLTEELIVAVKNVSELAASAELGEITTRINGTLDSVDRMTQSLATALGPLATNLNGTAGAATQTLERVGMAMSVVERGSPLQRDLHRALDDISSAAKAVRSFAELLERNPDALLYGKSARRR